MVTTVTRQNAAEKLLDSYQGIASAMP